MRPPRRGATTSREAAGQSTCFAPDSFTMIGDVDLAPWAIVIVDTWMWTPYVMLICLAGLRSIPDYIYEAAEVDRASPWRQFWTITLPMVAPFRMKMRPMAPFDAPMDLRTAMSRRFSFTTIVSEARMLNAATTTISVSTMP